MATDPLPYYITAMRADMRARQLSATGARQDERAAYDRMMARHEANRKATSDLIAIRTSRNVLANIIQANPNVFALVVTAFFLFVWFWYWVMSSPDAEYLSGPLREAMRGLQW